MKSLIFFFLCSFIAPSLAADCSSSVSWTSNQWWKTGRNGRLSLNFPSTPGAGWSVTLVFSESLTNLNVWTGGVSVSGSGTQWTITSNADWTASQNPYESDIQTNFAEAEEADKPEIVDIIYNGESLCGDSGGNLASSRPLRLGKFFLTPPGHS